MSEHPRLPAGAVSVRLAEAAPEPWRNGGGVTRTLLQRPHAGGGEPWRLRLSVAEVARDGPFSAFPGVRRWFAVLDGEGVALALPHGERVLHALGEPLEFDGAAAPGCRLLGGPTRDLNLMLRGAAGALHRTHPREPWQPAPGRACGLFAVQAGVWRHPGGSLLRPELSLLWFDAAPAGEQRFDGAGYWIEAELA